jgi:AcrR family transcriptional regulator
MSPTRRELVEATRERILAAADRLMHARGPQGFSMDVLAQEAGVARATVYEHFRSKRAVLDALATVTSSRISLDGQVPQGTEPLVELRDTLGAVCRHWAEHEEHARHLRTLAAVTGGEAADAVDEARLRRLVEGIATAGQLRPRWTVDDAVAALAVLTSYATYERLRRTAARAPAQVEALLAKLVVSIVSPNPQPASA